ncbi:MAG: DUF4115 domain-containing protein [bacterium]|nr:DUF4115 domain-containing protein [bacterium]
MFKTKKVKSKTLGEYLRECREHSDLSISDIGRISQVQPKFILALEEGRYQNLPDLVYIKGFLKSLSLIYHVSSDELLAQYLGEQEIAKNIREEIVGSGNSTFSTPKFIFSPKTLWIGCLIFLGVASISYLYFQVSSLKRPPHLDVASPHENLTVNSAVLVVEGKTESGSNVYLNNQAIVVDAHGEFRENLSLAPGSNVLTIKATNRFGQSSEVTRQIIYQEKEIAGTATGTALILPEVRKLIFQVVIGDQAAWIEIEVDGQAQYTGTMLAGSSQSAVAQEKVVLTTGNAGTTKVILNGKDLGILGKEGETIRDIEFTK